MAVRIRPILTKGVRAQEAAQKDIIRVMNDRVVIVLDPDEQKARLIFPCRHQECQAANPHLPIACSREFLAESIPSYLQDYLDKVQGRTKEKKYTFDIAFGKDVRSSPCHAKRLCSISPHS